MCQKVEEQEIAMIELRREIDVYVNRLEAKDNEMRRVQREVRQQEKEGNTVKKVTQEMMQALE